MYCWRTVTVRKPTEPPNIQRIENWSVGSWAAVFRLGEPFWKNSDLLQFILPAETDKTTLFPPPCYELLNSVNLFQESYPPGNDPTFGQMDGGTLRICVSAEQLWSRSYNAERWLPSLSCVLMASSFAFHSQTVWSTKFLFTRHKKGIQKILFLTHGEDG